MPMVGGTLLGLCANTVVYVSATEYSSCEFDLVRVKEMGYCYLRFGVLHSLPTALRVVNPPGVFQEDELLVFDVIRDVTLRATACERCVAEHEMTDDELLRRRRGYTSR